MRGSPPRRKAPAVRRSCSWTTEIPKSTLSQHFRALREAGLIRSERQGVEMRNTTRCAEINSRFPGLLPALMGAYQQQLIDRMKAAKRKGSKAKSG